ncbi:MAG: DUF1499 domain-containing protein [Gammaproteobacteria bacterium]|nr:DUF1499 domain-containing protein [Gammaproteobacteria bacterium]MDH3561075.1 DUF1499 domain-containing protein [Gammaproteobacteria bacterium]
MFATRSITAILIVATLMTSATTARVARQLAACPQSPNCVSSQADDGQHAIKPFAFTGSAQTAWDQLRSAILSQQRTSIVEEDANYLHAEARSRVFGFIDDVEFLLVPEEQLIHVRSAARTGHSDFGVNRRRVERLRRAFTGQ